MESEFFEIGELKLLISKEHRFGTDALLLSRFAAPHRKDIVCDLCTGCGIIPFLLLKEFGVTNITALDIDEDAIALLEQSVGENGLTNQIKPVLADLRDNKLPIEYFDIVTVNPPYFKAGSGLPATRRLSAARQEILCDLSEVIAASARLLRFGGEIFLCQRPERITDLCVAMRKNNLEPKRMALVFSTKEHKSPWLVLMSGKKGGNPGLSVEYWNKEDYARWKFK